MSSEKEQNKQLLKWLQGELSQEELKEFQESADFNTYDSIIKATEEMKYPVMDEKKVYNSIQQTIASRKQSNATSRIITLNRWLAAVAAIALLAFAIVSIMPHSNEVVSEAGQYVFHSLPDGSTINLNGNSQVKYEKSFKDERTLSLEGEAFFEVQKGTDFTVETPNGTIQVLGTSFNVYSRNNIFEVACKSGKVQVNFNDSKILLTKGERILVENDKTNGKDTIEVSKIANWIQGMSYYSNAPLAQVATSISSVYAIKIDLPLQYRERRFTGTFVHNDVEKALKMVFSPMDIPYTYTDDNIVLFSK